MGNTWEVWGYFKRDGQYAYHLAYRGESLRAVIRAAREARREGAGCVKVEWRP